MRGLNSTKAEALACFTQVLHRQRRIYSHQFLNTNTAERIVTLTMIPTLASQSNQKAQKLVRYHIVYDESVRVLHSASKGSVVELEH
jgi:hypothetical protein